ncbi:MAG: alpha-mannosidase [Firmicutes bacterium]|nr:alpha-mannosidase [Bacillota bacterium]
MYFYEERIRRIINELQGYIHPEKRNIPKFKMKPGPYSARNIDFDDSEGWVEFNPGDRWGERDKSFLFFTNVEIPKEFDGKTVVLEVKTGREGGWDALNPQFVVFINGNLIQGLDVNHREIILSEKASAGEVYNVMLHAYSGMHEGLVELNATIAILDRKVESLYYNLKVPYDVAVLLEKEDKRRIDIIGFLNETINILDLRKPFSTGFYESVDRANQYLEKEFYAKYCGHEDYVATCIGHTHIDVAWLWTLAQTREKTARSFSTVLSLMEQYPEYIFMSSQPQLYKFIKEDYPEIYEKIKERVKEGRWEPEGAMWLEADCNISSGESLVRQVLFGTRFFKDEFGIKNRILWLPDVFGYSAALPQILKKSGVDYFMTTKISWNEYNKLPYDTFMWRGIDGTEILTHFITTRERNFKNNSYITTYNGILAPPQIIGAWERYQQKDLNNDVLVSFGYGDGGGGPTKEMLENARRMAKGIPGCPKVKIGKSLDYFKKLEKKLAGNKKLPKWVGELYLEYHRGTYTSMARNKKFNRKCEFLYQDAEMLSVIGKYVAGWGEYPQEKINNGWEILLLNQFHDILPGSSIKEVYEDSKEQYLAITEAGRNLINNAIKGIAAKIDLKDTSVTVFNQLSFERSDLVEVELPDGYNAVEIIDRNGKVLPSQLIADCGVVTKAEKVNNPSKRRVLFFAENVPSKGYKAFKIRPINVEQSTNSINSINSISNEFFDIKFDENYNITSIYDKVNCREVVKEGQRANVIQAFEDKPHNYDAWDINIYYQEKMWEVNDVESAEVVENGPVRTAVKLIRKFLDSIIEQYIYIYNQVPRIDFKTRVDWKEKQILLKAAFPVDVHSDKATFEIQYGNVERPTHWNTSWDVARFESVAHKWVDLSEDDYGVSLLNESKYGHDIKDSVIRISLLKSAIYPNVDADREVHEFTYSLYPHKGDWREGNTVQMAYFLNCPMYSIIEDAHTGELPEEFSLAKIDKENVVIEVVKKAEDSEDIIIRMYECYNRRTKATLTFFKKLSEVWECDLMENNIERVGVTGNSFEFIIKPYEIKTFKIRVI